MEFGLDKKHTMARSLFREFAENEVKPLAQEVDETEQFPVETVEKMARYGFMGIPIPKQYGGQGADILTYAMCVEELSKVCGTPVSSFLHIPLSAWIRSLPSEPKSRR